MKEVPEKSFDEPRWLDFRLYEPPSNGSDRYLVLWLGAGITILGIARWMPDDGYKTGKWINLETTTGVKHDGEILAWMPHPKSVEVSL